MKRREFFALLGGAVAAWPLAVRAQQGERVRRIGVLLPASADDARFQTFVGAFLQELQSLGWSIGRNVRIDTRWGHRQCSRHSQIHGGIGRAHARCHPGPWLFDRGAVATGDKTLRMSGIWPPFPLRPGWPRHTITARSSRQSRRFPHLINADKVFGTHRGLERAR